MPVVKVEPRDALADLPTLAAQFEQDVQRVQTWVNADANTDYLTETSVAVPSVQKVIANVNAMIAPDLAKINQAVTDSQTAASSASASETNSASSASAASTSATNSAASANAANASATNASDDASRADASSTSAASARDAAVTAQNNAQTSANAAASSATQASNSQTAASASQTAASTSETNAASSASAANTSAGNSAASASAALGSQNAAKTSETNSAASASAAATSATNAKTSETNAANSAASINPATLLKVANNLSDVANAATSCSNLGAVKKSGDTMSGTLTVPSLAFADGSTQNTAPLSNRNYIVDGNWDSWISASAATSGTTPVRNTSTLTVFCAGLGGAGTIGQASFAIGGEPSGMTTPVTYFANFVQNTPSTGTVAANNAPYMSQSVENVRTLQGRSATYSIWLWTGSGSITIPTVICRQTFGTGSNSPSAQVVADKNVNWVLTTIPQRFSVRLDIPSIAGKTIGNNSDSLLQLGLWFPPGVTFNLGIGQWQLERSSPTSSSDINGAGGSPTLYEYRGQQAELARVQRHYYTLGSSAQAVLCMSAITSATGMFGAIQFPVTMRAPPACTSANMQGSSIAQVSPGTSSSYAYSTTQAVALTLNCSGATWTAGQAGVVYVGGISGGGGAFIADARLS